MFNDKQFINGKKCGTAVFCTSIQLRGWQDVLEDIWFVIFFFLLFSLLVGLFVLNRHYSKDVLRDIVIVTLKGEEGAVWCRATEDTH